MAKMRYIQKLFKPKVLDDASDAISGLGMAFILLNGLLIFHHNSQQNTELFKFKPYTRDSLKLGLARIVLSPFIAFTLSVLFLFQGVMSWVEGIRKIVKGKIADGFVHIFRESMGSVIGIFYALLLIIGAPLLHVAKFMVRSVCTLQLLFARDDEEEELSSLFEQIDQKLHYEKYFKTEVNVMLQDCIPIKDLNDLIEAYAHTSYDDRFFANSKQVFLSIYQAMYAGETTFFKRNPKQFDKLSFFTIKKYGAAHPESRTAKALDIFHKQWLDNYKDLDAQEKLTFKAIHQHCESHSGFFSSRFFPVGKNSEHDMHQRDGERSQSIYLNMPSNEFSSSMSSTAP